MLAKPFFNGIAPVKKSVPSWLAAMCTSASKVAYLGRKFVMCIWLLDTARQRRGFAK
jgi:hypothetical protein